MKNIWKILRIIFLAMELTACNPSRPSPICSVLLGVITHLRHQKIPRRQRFVKRINMGKWFVPKLLINSFLGIQLKVIPSEVRRVVRQVFVVKKN